MTTPTSESVKALADGLTKGAVKAVTRMTADWQFAGRSTFDHNGAWNAARKVPSVVERQLQKDGKYSRHAYRLTPLGLAITAHLGASHG